MSSPPSVTLAVCGVHEVPLFVSANPTDIVSIGSATQPPPDFTPFPATNVVRFEFDDVCHSIPKPGETCVCPSAAEVARIIDLADQIKCRADDTRILFHCQAGISRSTAAAFIFWVRLGATYQEAYSTLLRVRGAIAPNILMIKYADIAMKREGKMLDYVASHRPDAKEWVVKNGYVFD